MVQESQNVSKNNFTENVDGEVNTNENMSRRGRRVHWSGAQLIQYYEFNTNFDNGIQIEGCVEIYTFGGIVDMTLIEL